jgi:hypothetical protein
MFQRISITRFNPVFYRALGEIARICSFRRKLTAQGLKSINLPMPAEFHIALPLTIWTRRREQPVDFLDQINKAIEFFE